LKKCGRLFRRRESGICAESQGIGQKGTSSVAKKEKKGEKEAANGKPRRPETMIAIQAIVLAKNAGRDPLNQGKTTRLELFWVEKAS